MNTNIKTTNIVLTASISDYADKRFKKIFKSLKNKEATQCDIELARVTEHHNKGDIFRAEIHLVGSGKNFYASSEQSDLYAAIDAVRDEILRELKSKKEKHLAFIRHGGARMKAMIKELWPWKGNRI
jgi:putative sigma-54 modulation protein